MMLIAGMHCTECGYNCHEKCVQHVPKNCSKVRPASQLTSLAAAAADNVRSVTAAGSGIDATLVASPTQTLESTARGMLVIPVKALACVCKPSVLDVFFV